MNPHIIAILKRDEGVRLFPYLDTAAPPKWTIGCGRNLSDNGISHDEVEYLLGNDVFRTEIEAKSFPWYDALDEVRQAVVLSMIFNLGLTKFKGFYNTIRAIERHDYETAAALMLQSKWAKQVGARATRLSEMMRTGNVK
jgi:lysozyme